MTEKRKRRWFQFSLRALLVFVLVVSIAMSWLAVKLRRARNQQEAVKAVVKAGAEVAYDYELDGALGLPEAPAPAWLRALFGDDLFHDMSLVCLPFPEGTDAELEHLKGLKNLVWLELDRTQVTDAGLQHLKGLTKLEWLSLDGTQVSDAGLEHVKALTKLKWLALGSTQVSDAGLQHLKGLSNLEELGLDSTQVTDAGLEHLKGLTNLEVLVLRNTQVTPEGVKKLQEALPECEIAY